VPPAPLKSWRRLQISIFVATWTAYAGLYFCRMNFYVVKASLERELGFSAIELGHLGTAYLAAYMLGQFGAALFGRWLGPKKLLLAGTGISLGVNFLLGFSHVWLSFLVLVALNGLAQGTGWPGCIGSLGWWFERRQRGTVLGIWATCYQLGPFLASNFAGLMLGRAGFRWAFWAAALVLLAVWALVLWLHPNTPQDCGYKVEQDIKESTAGSAEPAEGWSGAVVVTVLMMGGIYFCIKFSRYLLFSWSAYFLEKNFGLSGEKAAYTSTVFYAAGFAGTLLSGWITDRFFAGRRAMVALVMMLGMCLCFLAMAVGGGDLSWFVFWLGAAGFMLYGPDALLSGVGAIDVARQKKALAAAGIINGMGSAGPLFQEEAVGLLYQHSGRIESVLWLLLAVAALGTLLMAILWLGSRRRPEGF